MLVRRLSAGALCFLAGVALISSRVSSETGDKQLARVKGVVGYQASSTSEFKPIFGRFDLPDDSFAVTKPHGSAVLRLKDSSEIDIGESTKVQVGAFNTAASGNVNTIVLNGGALHFNIRHPQGGQSNYKFVTATSQVAVRGTEGFLIAGPNGTQVACVSCAAGDVSVQVGQQTISLVSNQTVTVLGTNPLNATTSITTNPNVNNPAVNQFNNNTNPFTTHATTPNFDPTAALSGSSEGAAAAGIAGTVAAVGAVAATAAVVATVTKPGGAASPPSPQPAVGTLVVQISYPGATNFPYAFSWPFSQLNATGTATFTCGPSGIIACTPQQSINANGVLNGVLSGNLAAAGAFTVGGNASGYVLSPTTLNVYGAVRASAQSLNFTNALPETQNIIITQAGAAAITASISCPASGASATLSPSSGSSPLQIRVTASSAPSSGSSQPVACVITAHGQGDGPLATTTINVNITATAIGISAHRRKTN